MYVSFRMENIRQNKKKKIVWFIVIMLLLVILRSLFFSSDTHTAYAPPLLRVKAVVQHAEPIEREISFTGRTEPARRAIINAETSGLVVQIGAERGEYVETGDLIVAIDMQDREQKLAEAKALVRQREIEFTAIQDLRKKSLASESQLASTATALESAKALRDNIEIDIRDTRIVAPFSGFLETREVEIGHHLVPTSFSLSPPVATIIETNPLIVTGFVSEHNILFIKKGMPAIAFLATGQVLDGFVRFVSPSANDESRTFKVEAEFSNASLIIPAGITAHVSVPGDTLFAHPVSPDQLTLNNAGDFGIKALSDTNHVVFYPAKWVKATQDTIWLEGLPETLHLITAGQGFAQEGEQVEPLFEVENVEQSQAL